MEDLMADFVGNARRLLDEEADVAREVVVEPANSAGAVDGAFSTGCRPVAGDSADEMLNRRLLPRFSLVFSDVAVVPGEGL